MTDVWSMAADLLDPPINEYLADPVAWTREVARSEPWSKQVEILESVRDHRKTAVKACHGAGKALPLDTPIPTPTGWTTMGALRPGDQVLDERGKPCTVTAITPIERRDCYRITFADRTTIDAADTHEWNAIDIHHRPRVVADWRDHWAATTTVTTAHLAANLHARSQLRWRIPTNRPLDTAEPWPVRWDPYTFGAWLGDGTTIRAELTCHMDDAPHFIAETGGWHVSTRHPTCARIQFAPRSYLDCPGRELGGKVILPAMLRGTFADRLALLRGLMDTDGTMSTGSAVDIALCSESLVDSIEELVHSLGWVSRRSSRPAKINGRTVGTSHRLIFRPDVNPFRLPRKAELWAKNADDAGQRSRHTQRTITSVEPIGERLVRCIEVDSPRHLYLAGRSMVPTHNSFIAADVVGHWGDTHHAGTATAVTTAPTARQISLILWKELRRVHKRASLDGRIIGGNGNEEWKINDETVASGRKPADHDEDGFQGIHDDYVLVVLDEACGIPKSLWTATDTLVTNEDSRILAIGNPDHPTSEFASICEGAPEDGTSGFSKAGWWVITISTFDTPNFTDEHVSPEVAKKLPSRLWLDEVTAKWGIGSALYQSKVLGLFPEDSNDGVIPWSWLKTCQGEEATERIGPLRVPVELGVDVGGSDDGDETVIRCRKGLRISDYVARLQTGDSEVIVDKVIEAIRDTEATAVKVDVIGVGFGVVGSLKRRVRAEISWPVAVHGVNVADAATEPEKFVNLKAEIWWDIGRELTRLKTLDLTDVDDETLLELSSPTYIEKNGRIQIESKAEVRKRLGRSTDNADALLLALYSPPAETTVATKRKYKDARLKGRR